MALRRHHRLVAYCLGIAGLGSNALIYFILPLRALEMGASLSAIGLLLGTKSLVEAGLSIPLGNFINRVGAKSAFLTGSLGVGCAGAGLALAESLILLVAFQVVLGIFRPLVWVGGQAYVSAMGAPSERARDTGHFSFATNVGQIVAPLIAGGAVGVFGAQAAFLVLTLYGGLFSALSLFIPDVGRSPFRGGGQRSSSRAAVRLLRSAPMQLVLLLTFTRLWLPTIWVAFLPLFLVTQGASVGVAATAASSMALVATLTTLFTGRLARLGRPTTVTTVALGMSCLGVALTPLASGIPAVYLPAALVGIGQGISLPLLLVLVSETAPPSQRNLALSLRTGISQAAAAAAPLVVTPIIGIGGLGMGFASASGVGALLLVGAVVLAKRVGAG